MKNLRLSIFKSNKHFYVQLIDDKDSNTLLSSSTLQLNIKNQNITKKAKIILIGQDIANKALKKEISHVIFDKRNKRYSGLIKIFAETIRNSGLNF